MATTHMSSSPSTSGHTSLSTPHSIAPRPLSPSASLSNVQTTPTKQTTPPRGSGDQCAVCGDIAPPATVFRRHYGVICCEACKCFFRRTVQMGRDYKCRFSGTCPVGRNAINIKQVCQACRFSRCTQAGMKIESVKKFPRKPKDEKKHTATRKKSTNQTSSVYLNGNPLPPPPPTIPIGTKTPPLNNETTSTIVEVKQEKGGEEGGASGYDSDFEHFRFNISSPDLSIYSGVLESSLPKLFSGESLENIHEKSSIPTPESLNSENADKRSPQVLLSASSPVVVGRSASPLKIAKQPSPLINAQVVATGDEMTSEMTRPEEMGVATTKDLTTPTTVKRSAANINWNEMLLKKQRLEDALNHITARQVQVKANLQRLSAQNTTYLSHPNIGGSGGATSISTHSTPSLAPPTSMITPTLTHIGNIPQDHHTPYATPHDTPHGTPVPSPLPSPNLYHPSPILQQQQQQQHTYVTSQPPTPHQIVGVSQVGVASCVQTISAPGTPVNGSLPTSPINYKPPNSNYYFTNNNYHGPLTGINNLPLDHSSGMPSLVGGASNMFGPPTNNNNNIYHHSTTTLHPPYNGGGGMGGVISSMPGSTVTSPTVDQECLLPSFTRDSFGKLTVEIPDTAGTDNELIHINNSRRGSLTSAPTSACPSPLLKPSRTLASDAPEAEVEEVLEALKRSIKHMFKWAKSEVKDFDDLSPMDQKALLRRTVPELVMLGFARASIPYDDMLLLGGTGKVMRPTNGNSGVSAVAIVTLSKLVVPLKVLNMDDQELRLMKEIVLFNPESNCLRDKETVREYRRRKHIELMEYTERNQPGRFGELLCLLTPLYEVSTEVTEQLRLEQFVHEGEARIDALLLMSMINQGGGVTEEPMEGGEPVM